MKKIEVIIRPEKLEDLKKILTKNEYSGMTPRAPSSPAAPRHAGPPPDCFRRYSQKE